MTISNWLSTLNRRDSRLFPNFSRLSKVFLLLIVSVCLVSFSARIFAYASLKDKQDAAKEGGNQEAWLDESMSSNVVSSIKLISGPIPDNVLAGEVKTFVPLGAIGSINNLVASTFTPAASGIEYVAQMKDDFLGKPAYAQGIGVGFHGLQPILPLWRGFRNVIYIISSLIFAVIVSN